MFDHVTIRVADRAASRAFYDLALGELGFAVTNSGEHFDEWWDFGIAQERDDRPETRGLHVAFVARSREAVDAWWQTLTQAGHPDDGAPGPRPEYHSRYYGAFVRDPDGNSVEAVFHGRLRPGPNRIDHLWIRVADLRQSRRFYDLIAPYAGVRWGIGQDSRVHYAAANRSFAIVAGASVTENVHFAFPAPDNETVDRFHHAAIAAGYRDNGAPGERPEYHDGYYGAFVLDPDRNNVELVCHNRD